MNARRHRALLGSLVSTLTVVGLGVTSVGSALAADRIGLGTAGSFAVLAGSAVTNTGPSVINGDAGVSPGSALPVFSGPPNGTLAGTTHANDEIAVRAQTDLTTAFDEAGALATTAALPAQLGGRTLTAGVYDGAALLLDGTLTLRGSATDVFVIRATSTLTTGTDSVVALEGAVDPCNVFFRIGSSATLGTRTTFVGTVLAQAAITVVNGTSVRGRLLARTEAVTLDSNVVTRPSCSPLVATSPSPSPAPSATAASPSPADSPSPTSTASPSPSAPASAPVAPAPVQDADPTPAGGPTSPAAPTPTGTVGPPAPTVSASTRPARAPSGPAPAPARAPAASGPAAGPAAPAPAEGDVPFGPLVPNPGSVPAVGPSTGQAAAPVVGLGPVRAATDAASAHSDRPALSSEAQLPRTGTPAASLMITGLLLLLLGGALVVASTRADAR